MIAGLMPKITGTRTVEPNMANKCCKLSGRLFNNGKRSSTCISSYCAIFYNLPFYNKFKKYQTKKTPCLISTNKVSQHIQIRCKKDIHLYTSIRLFYLTSLIVLN